MVVSMVEQMAGSKDVYLAWTMDMKMVAKMVELKVDQRVDQMAE